MTAAGMQARRLVLMVGELHKLGYERLRIAPHLADSPGGPVWRCQVIPDFFTDAAHGAVQSHCPSELTYYYSTRSARGSEQHWPELANPQPDLAAAELGLTQNRLCMAGLGSDPEYVTWYAEMLKQTKPDGVIYVGPPDVQGEDEQTPPGMLAVFYPERPEVVQRVAAPPPALIHGSDLNQTIPLVRKIAEGSEFDTFACEFWTNVLEFFEASSAPAREYLTAAVKSNPAALKTLFTDEVLVIGEGPSLLSEQERAEQSSDHVNWLRRTLCVVSLTDGFEDSRDTMMYLASVWRQAEDYGLDPTPHFQHYANIASDRADHTFCGSAQLMMLMVLDSGTRDSLRY